MHLHGLETSTYSRMLSTCGGPNSCDGGKFFESVGDGGGEREEGVITLKKGDSCNLCSEIKIKTISHIDYTVVTKAFDINYGEHCNGIFWSTHCIKNMISLSMHDTQFYQN